MACPAKAFTPCWATLIQLRSVSRSSAAQGVRKPSSPASGRMESIIRSALISGICKVSARDRRHMVDLPEPLWPARMMARGLFVRFWAARMASTAAGRLVNR
ncbi:hypothetical protein D3C72_1978960 [compost metagenome]